MACSNPDCDMYPYYGVAPHRCGPIIGKGIGGSEALPVSEWPSNFLPDGEIAKEGEYPGCGMYVCPDCGVKEND